MANGATMRVVIVGVGDAGQRLAAKLCEEKHDVVLVDHRTEPLEEISAELDVQTVQGTGTSPQILEEAGVAKAGLVAAVTDRDEVNLLAAIFSHAAGAGHTAVRVSNTELTAEQHLNHLARLGIDLVVNEHDECAREVLSILNMGGAKEVVRMVEGRIHAVGLDVPESSPLLACPLKDFPHPGILNAVRLIAVMRKEELLVPRGDMTFEPKDTLYCVGRPDSVRAFLNVVQPDRTTMDKVIVLGGGDLGLRLTQYLEKTGKDVDLVEIDSARADACSAGLQRARVSAGNGCDRSMLEEIGITSGTAVVASMGNDENNIIACLLARKMGAAFGIALISKPEYVPIINEAGLLDRAVSPYLTTMNAILRFVRGTSIRAMTILQNVPGELLEIHLPDGSKWEGRALKDARLPRQAIVAAVVRGEETEIATGDTVLRAGDRLIVFVRQGAATRLEAAFRK